MFLEFFYELRGLGVPVSPLEWLTLMEGLAKGLHNDSVEDFYHLARSVLVKDVSRYDAFDQAFSEVFGKGFAKGGLKKLAGEGPTREEILRWLEEGLAPLRLSEEELARMGRLTLEELLRELEDRLATQDGPHNGGHHWIGTGGTSPFGARGSHPTGISFDPVGGGGGAMLRAYERRYKNFRNDLTLDVRQMSVALKKLRDLRRAGEETLDLDATIDRTCREGGEIELVFGRERENQVRLLLAMDTGGSMEVYRHLSERLFSAADGLNHFKEFRSLYFHNCVYDNLYTDVERGEFVPVEKLVRDCAGENYRLIIMGDAAMAPYELMIPNGFLERRRTSRVKGIERMKALARAYPKRAWLNPMPESSWDYYETVAVMRGLFPMYPLTVAGLTRAVKELR
jgi:uncharacterized protein with von Willebrand factor type A (vWA) domain